MNSNLSPVNTLNARLTQLRAVLQQQHIAAVLVPSSDPHLSEYLPDHWAARAWLSGFTGSMGTLIVTQEFAGLWTDSRYWEQAANELDGSGITLMKLGSPGVISHAEWLMQNCAGKIVAVDAQVIAMSQADSLLQTISKTGVNLRTDIDLPGCIWANRPQLPNAPIYQHKYPHARVARSIKLTDLRIKMELQKCNVHVISTLDDLAWLFNLRGSDVEYNPVFIAHAIIEPTVARIFIDLKKVSSEIKAALAADGVVLEPYEDFSKALQNIPKSSRVLLDPARITLGVKQAIAKEVAIVELINPTTLSKSKKNLEEIAQVRAAMEADGAALCEFYSKLDAAFARGERITELTIDEMSTSKRAEKSGYISLSFSTIAAFNANGAMPHYRALPASHALITGDGLLLIDSGAQYLGGTTDITRVWAIGTPSAAQKEDFTHVLKALINLSRIRFPKGIRAPMLDAIARVPLWDQGLDYGHGTGHGVGYFLNVHEGPQTISQQNSVSPHTAMEIGMITSIEPGIYRPGKWGIRLENLVCNQLATENEFGEFLHFETLTLCPIDTSCIVRSLLRDDEAQWLNDYHATTRARLLPHVSDAAKTWLLQRTEPI